MDKKTFKRIFWKQYLLLERDFLETDEFVSIDKANNKTFSNRYTYILLNVCSEMDSVSEEFCKQIEKTDKIKQNTIVKKIDKIIETVPLIRNCKVKTKFPYAEMYFVPFQKFDDNSSAEWWKAYNKVKHSRADIPEKGIPNYQLANLKNVMSAMSALYILCTIFFFSLEGEWCDLEESRLFEKLP